MTTVIVALHDQGVVRVYCRQPDGRLDQTGRFVTTDQIDPPALAELVANLADTLHWNGAPMRVAPPPPVPIGAGKTKKAKDFRSRPRASHAERERRRQAVIALLNTHAATAKEVGDAIFPGLPDPDGKARKILDQLVTEGIVEQVGGTGQPGDGRRYQTRNQT